MVSFLTKLAHEIGLAALHSSTRDTKILLTQRVVRFLAYGSTSLVLALFLNSLHISDERIGLFMTLTLLGDVVISLVLTIIADGIGRRRMLALGALLMVASGVVFALSSNYWVLVAASVFGVISPAGNEIGPFRAIEESTLIHLVSTEDRTGILAWYTVVGFAGASFGILIFGWVVRTLQVSAGWTTTESYRVVFWAYAMFGLVKFSLCLLLSDKCEPEKKEEARVPVQASEDETQPLLANGDGHHVGKPVKETSSTGKTLKSLLPALSKESASVVFKLCCLFALDSLGSGLTPNSWVTYFFNRKFNLSEGKLGTIFFATSIVGSASNLVAAPLARRIGLVKTMVFTHVPASVALALIPIPSNVIVAVALLVFRASTSSMDQAPRQAFLAAAVLPAERTAVMGAVNVVKTLSQSSGPFITGALAQRSLFWVAFIMAGGLKLLYDVLILGMFLGYRTVEERAEERIVTQRQQDEEDADANERSAPT